MGWPRGLAPAGSSSCCRPQQRATLACVPRHRRGRYRHRRRRRRRHRRCRHRHCLPPMPPPPPLPLLTLPSPTLSPPPPPPLHLAATTVVGGRPHTPPPRPRDPPPTTSTRGTVCNGSRVRRPGRRPTRRQRASRGRLTCLRRRRAGAHPSGVRTRSPPPLASVRGVPRCRAVRGGAWQTHQRGSPSPSSAA
ncbi:hypothetical protein I4F81_009716 [Pyropia yezoensis]|uniref:Uncharacterized protein n=1 Tax=Pyropia yezoensis TaxID=2788 RepID=A0ACC3CAM7_PYRYE|nr:hypothetical protein I4F81_009716 [Neopyropia yezoensis]